jgi:hypothetical protein
LLSDLEVDVFEELDAEMEMALRQRQPCSLAFSD